MNKLQYTQIDYRKNIRRARNERKGSPLNALNEKLASTLARKNVFYLHPTKGYRRHSVNRLMLCAEGKAAGWRAFFNTIGQAAKYAKTINERKKQ